MHIFVNLQCIYKDSGSTSIYSMLSTLYHRHTATSPSISLTCLMHPCCHVQCMQQGRGHVNTPSGEKLITMIPGRECVRPCRGGQSGLVPGNSWHHNQHSHYGLRSILLHSMGLLYHWRVNSDASCSRHQPRLPPCMAWHTLSRYHGDQFHPEGVFYMSSSLLHTLHMAAWVHEGM